MACCVVMCLLMCLYIFSRISYYHGMLSRISEKGQVTIPKRLRDRLGIRAGELLDFHEEEGRLVAVKHVERNPVDAVYGILAQSHRTDTVMEAMRGVGIDVPAP